MRLIILRGNLVEDPKYNEDGSVRLRLAVNMGYGEKQSTDYYVIFAKPHIGEICKKCNAEKGKLVEITGMLRNISEKKACYDNAGNEQTIYTNKVYVENVSEIEFISTGRKTENASAQPTQERKREEPKPIPGFEEAVAIEDPDLEEF